MAKIVVFDSGFGSLSIIRAIQKITKANIIYFADQKNFPYGTKSKRGLQDIIQQTIINLQDKFHPDLIIVGSNTPSLLFPNLFSEDIIGILPPLTQAAKITKTKSIAILATKSVVMSKELSQFIEDSTPNQIKVLKINASPLVDLVESGKFLYNKEICKKRIKQSLDRKLLKNKTDVVTLSSTHLPFLLDTLKIEYPQITFLDPADSIVNQILSKINMDKSTQNRLQIFTSSKPKLFQKNLRVLGIYNKVKLLIMP